MTIRSDPRAPILESGERLDEDLTVLDHLGGSRKVDIYLCRSRSLKRLVACKVLRPEYCIDFSSLEDILQEGEILMDLRHPNVVEGYGVDLEDYPRIVMQYLPGQTVAATFLEGNYAAFDLSDIISVVQQVAEALTYIHDRGLLHLDVKPSNVIYHEGHATLIDFSVAKHYSPDRPLRDNAGTRVYMAPEQTNRQEVGPYTDVFGLGVLFYALLTGGVLPYADEQEIMDTAGKTRRRLNYEVAPPAPSGLNSVVPDALSAVALAALRPEPGRRFHTVADFTKALLNAANNLA